VNDRSRRGAIRREAGKCDEIVRGVSTRSESRDYRHPGRERRQRSLLNFSCDSAVLSDFKIGARR